MSDDKNLRRWRLVLGGGKSDGTNCALNSEDTKKDKALSALYDYEIRENKFLYEDENTKSERGGGNGASSPSVARWLGDIRKYFPKDVVDIIQDDALEHEDLKDKLMFEPEILAKATPNVHLVATLMSLGKLIPTKTKETARIVVNKVVEELLSKLESRIIEAISGAISKNVDNHRPKYNEINWQKTILKNLKHYQKEYNTIVPEKLYGYGRKNRKSLKDIVLCIDQSGSMGSSIVYSAIFGSVMASLPTVSTKMVLFDTEIIDLTEELQDPVDVLFGVQMGGGTDINKALGYCQGLVSKPDDTIFVFISDLEEGGSPAGMLNKLESLKKSGVQVIVLLALNDDGKAYYSQSNAKAISKLNIPVFSCTPSLFPDLMATAISKGEINSWASQNKIVME